MSKIQLKEKTFSSAARTAKSRMKTGFWNVEREADRETQILINTKRQVYGELIMHDFGFDSAEELFNRIYAVVTAKENVINPIGQVICRGYFYSLTPESQQLYVFRLSKLIELVRKTYFSFYVREG